MRLFVLAATFLLIGVNAQEECPPEIPPVDCDPLPCDVATCASVPGAACINSVCGSCQAFFIDETGTTLSEEDCNTRDCPPGVPISACIGPLPCETETCPGIRGAQCRNNFCGGCTAVFTDEDGNVLSEDQCNGGDVCPESSPRVECLVPPCDVTSCPAVDGASCVNNFCGECSAIFIDGSGNVLTEDQCGGGCPDDQPYQNCLVPPCDTASCPAVAGATCRNDYCGGCRAVFTDNVGNVLDAEACFPERFCPALQSPSFEYSCSNSTYVGSTCRILCPFGRLNGPSSITCLEGGEWSTEPSTISCITSSCASLENPDWTYTCTRNYTVGSRCTVRCAQRSIFNLGISFTRCSLDRRWYPDPRYLRCRPNTRQTCPPFPAFPFFRNYMTTCTDSRFPRSRCDISCPANATLYGETSVTCQLDRTWTADLSRTQCVRAPVCPAQQSGCLVEPCLTASCPARPNAVCVNDYCSGCNYNFYENGRRLSRQACVPTSPCVFPPRFRCGNHCAFVTCEANPDALCRINCDCSVSFFDRDTVQQVAC